MEYNAIKANQHNAMQSNPAASRPASVPTRWQSGAFFVDDRKALAQDSVSNALHNAVEKPGGGCGKTKKWDRIG